MTGVPGAGKTLVGLDVATSHIDKSNEMYSVFQSGNKPLDAILREALTQDKVQRLKIYGEKMTKISVMSEVKMFIQMKNRFLIGMLIYHHNFVIVNMAPVQLSNH